MNPAAQTGTLVNDGATLLYHASKHDCDAAGPTPPKPTRACRYPDGSRRTDAPSIVPFPGVAFSQLGRGLISA
jgi:hypothetical protein